MPTTADLLDRIWRRTIHSLDWRAGYSWNAAVGRVDRDLCRLRYSLKP